MADAQLHSKSDPKEFAKSHQLWVNFNKITKWVIIAIIVVLALMALILV